MSEESVIGIVLDRGPRDGELRDFIPRAKRLNIPIGFAAGAEQPFLWASYLDSGRIRDRRKVFVHDPSGI